MPYAGHRLFALAGINRPESQEKDKMKKHLISINDLPPDGKEFMLDDQDIWLGPIGDFRMDCRILEPLRGKVFVQRADEGVLLRGSLQGKIAVPCNRCTEDAVVAIDSHFDEYEEIPPEDIHKKKDQPDGYIVYQMHAPMLDLGELGWEQFMLAQPIQPVCKEDCKGLCPECGKNLNEGDCDCNKDAGDPRMAALRGVKINK